MTRFIPVSQLFRFTFNTVVLYSHTCISNYNFPDIFQDTQPSYILVKAHFFPLKLFIITQTKSELPLLTLTAFKNLLIAFVCHLRGVLFFFFWFLFFVHMKLQVVRGQVLHFMFISLPTSVTLSQSKWKINEQVMNEWKNEWMAVYMLIHWQWIRLAHHNGRIMSRKQITRFFYVWTP